MAHVGKTFPVIDRRDVNLNVSNYNNGFARRYSVHLQILPPGFGNILQGTIWDCGPGGVENTGRIFWGSAPKLIGPFVYDVILTALIVNGSEYTKRCLIREAIGGDILELELINDPAPRSPEFQILGTWITIFRDPLFFTGPGFANQVNAFRKLWTDPPPH